MNPLITAVLGGLNIDGILGRFFPSKEKAQEFKATMEQELLRQEGEITKAAIAANAEQIAVNKVEASSASIFIAGWRPFIGWVCGSALVVQYIASPLLPWFAAVVGFTVPPIPSLDDSLWQLMAGLLGLGGMRTFEKMKGVDRGSLKK
jgi:hypothetical protein